nr:XdhC family protein [Enterovibrio nigricans]
MENRYLALDELYISLKQGISGHYVQQIHAQSHGAFTPISDAHHILSDRQKKGRIIQKEQQDWLRTFIQPPIHLLIAGGGLDAQPVATIAKALGWKISLWDPRPANARLEHFTGVDTFLRGDAATLSQFCNEQHVDALIIMSHNLSLDASVLESTLATSLNYIALLGPENRKAEVFTRSRIIDTDLPCKVYGPAGLNLGAALPEGIAISILSECVAVLNGADTKSLSGK